MESVLRAVVAFVFFMIVFRVVGKRAIKEMTMLDFVLMNLLTATVFYMLSGGDFSMANGLVLASTLLLLNIITSHVMSSSRRAKEILDGVPIIIVKDGELYEDHMKKSSITVNDILMAGRNNNVEKLEDIKYAVLEKNGEITVIKKDD